MNRMLQIGDRAVCSQWGVTCDYVGRWLGPGQPCELRDIGCLDMMMPANTGLQHPQPSLPEPSHPDDEYAWLLYLNGIQ